MSEIRNMNLMGLMSRLNSIIIENRTVKDLFEIKLSYSICYVMTNISY